METIQIVVLPNGQTVVIVPSAEDGRHAADVFKEAQALDRVVVIGFDDVVITDLRQ